MERTKAWVRNVNMVRLRANVEPFKDQEDVDSHKGVRSPMRFGNVTRVPTIDEVDEALRGGQPEILARLAVTPDGMLFGFSKDVVRRARAIFNFACLYEGQGVTKAHLCMLSYDRLICPSRHVLSSTTNRDPLLRLRRRH